MRKRRVRDNKGMSLVEVIIAITILGVVIVPVFQALTTAMVYNAKARVRQNLTITAESIMETFKGYSLDSLKNIFAGTGGIAGVTGGGYSYEADYTDDDGNVITGGYKFTITDFDQNNDKYSAEITVIPNGTQDVYEVRDISTTTNAVFVSDRDYDKNLKNNMYNTYKGNTSGEVDGFYALFESIRSDLERDYAGSTEYNFIDLKIYPGGSPAGTDITTDTLQVEDVKNYIKIHDRTTTFEINGTSATVNIEYHYTIENFPYSIVLEKIANSRVDSPTEDGDIDLVPDIVFDGESGREEINTSVSCYPSGSNDYLTYKVSLKGSSDIYSNTTSMERLYVYYYPLYEKEDGSLIKDIIKFNNNSNINFNVYLIKQVASDLSTANITIGEEAYSPDITVSGTGEVYLYHNLDINVATGLNKAGGYIIPSSFKGGGHYTYSTDFVKEEQLSYKVVVRIKNGGNVVSTLESTMNEKINDNITTVVTEEPSEEP